MRVLKVHKHSEIFIICAGNACSIKYQNEGQVGAAKERSRYKILIICSFLLTLVSIVFVALTPIADKYELSIYNSYPDYVYFLLILSFVLDIYLIVIIFLARKKEQDNNIIGLYSLINAALISTLLLLMPLLRGYAFFERHDSLANVGMIIDINLTGQIGSMDFYPAMHILSYVFTGITGITSISYIRVFIILAFFYLYIMVIYVLGKKTIGCPMGGYFSAAVATIPMVNGSIWQYTPSDQTYLLIPFVLFCYSIRSNKNNLESSILLLVSLFIIPFEHPEISVFLMISFFFIYIISKYGKNKRDHRLFFPGFSFTPTLVLLVAFFAWFSTFTSFKQFSLRLLLWFSQGIGDIPVETYSSLISKSNFDLAKILEVAGLLYCCLIIISVLGIFAFIIVLRNRNNLSELLVFISIIFMFSLFFAIFCTFGSVILDLRRASKYVFLFAPILLCFMFMYINNKNFNLKNIRLIKYIGPIAIVSILFLVSLYSLYPSPYVAKYNQQITNAEFLGSGWLVEQGSRDYQTQDIIYTFGRFVQALEGYSNSFEFDYNYSTALYDSSRHPPDHFNYYNGTSLGEIYTLYTYLITSNVSKAFYLDLWSDSSRYDQNDFIKLNYDLTIAKLYCNSDLEVRFIQPKTIM